MDSREQKILAAFDVPGARARSLSDLGDPAIVKGVVSQLVERGWLRPTESPDKYARTEDGRLQLAAPRDVTIYSRPGCHLCEEAKAQIAPLLKEFGARLTDGGYEVLNDVVLNQVLVAFGDGDATRQVIRAVQDEGTCWCGGTEWHGRAAMRISVSSWATTAADIDRSAEAIMRIASRIVSS